MAPSRLSVMVNTVTDDNLWLRIESFFRATFLLGFWWSPLSHCRRVFCPECSCLLNIRVHPTMRRVSSSFLLWVYYSICWDWFRALNSNIGLLLSNVNRFQGPLAMRLKYNTSCVVHRVEILKRWKDIGTQEIHRFRYRLSELEIFPWAPN